MTKPCTHPHSMAVDIDGTGEDFRYCNDCGENFWTTFPGEPAPAIVRGARTPPAVTVQHIERQVLAIIESSIEDSRVPDAIAAHAEKRAGKPVTKTDAEQLEKTLGVPVRISRRYGSTLIAWAVGKGTNPWLEERSIQLSHSETGARWPSGEKLRASAPAYFEARDERNAARRTLLQEHQTLRNAIGGETPDPDDESAICRVAQAIVKLRAAREELFGLIDDGQPLHVVRSAVEKLAQKE